MSGNISPFIKSVLIRLYPDGKWNCTMSVKLVNYILRRDYRGEYFVSIDDHGKLALFEREF